jgi:hypothetical protein
MSQMAHSIEHRPRRSPLAIIGAVFVGIAIVNIIKWQVAGGRERFAAMVTNRRAVKAKELYLAHCDVALANPSLSGPDADTLDFASGRLAGSKDAFERYEWYVARLIYTLDECLRLDPEGQWEAVAKTQLRSHRVYLASDYYMKQGYLSHYSICMRTLINQQRN